MSPARMGLAQGSLCIRIAVPEAGMKDVGSTQIDKCKMLVATDLTMKGMPEPRSWSVKIQTSWEGMPLGSNRRSGIVRRAGA